MDTKLYPNERISSQFLKMDTKLYPNEHPTFKEKIRKCLFRAKKATLCPFFQTNYGNSPLLKLDFLKIELSPIVAFLRSL